MATATVDEFVTKISQLPKNEREELVRRLNALKSTDTASAESTVRVPENGVPKQPLHPNTVWIKENSHRFRGMHVALKDGNFIASGRTTKEADQAAEAKGFSKYLLTYIPGENEILWGGW